MQAHCGKPTAVALTYRSAMPASKAVACAHSRPRASLPPLVPRPPAQQQQPQLRRRQRGSRAVTADALLSSGQLVGLGIFFSPSIAALVYAYWKGKGNLTDGLSRLLTDISQVCGAVRVCGARVNRQRQPGWMHALCAVPCCAALQCYLLCSLRGWAVGGGLHTPHAAPSPDSAPCACLAAA